MLSAAHLPTSVACSACSHALKALNKDFSVSSVFYDRGVAFVQQHWNSTLPCASVSIYKLGVSVNQVFKISGYLSDTSFSQAHIFETIGTVSRN